MNGPMDEDQTVRPLGGTMALKELEQLTGELEELATLLRREARPQARLVIMRRVQEIMGLIEKGMKE